MCIPGAVATGVASDFTGVASIVTCLSGMPST